jgi:Flavodoxin domain
MAPGTRPALQRGTPRTGPAGNNVPACPGLTNLPAIRPRAHAGDVRSLIVYESCFGNTRAIAEAVAAGLLDAVPGVDVDVIPVSAAPATLDAVDLLILGAPTHFRTLSTRASRWLHAQYWGEESGPRRRHWPHGRPRHDASLRAWLGTPPVSANPCRAAVFDTCVAGAASGGAALELKGRLLPLGVGLVAPPEHFYVRRVSGPLCAGEGRRARVWGAHLLAGPDGDQRAPAVSGRGGRPRRMRRGSRRTLWPSPRSPR